MALSKKGLRKITVQGECFYWRVRKKISATEAEGEQLGIPIQHECGGQLLIAFVDMSRGTEGEYFDPMNMGTVVTPAMIKRAIEGAIAKGWQFQQAGKPIGWSSNGRLLHNIHQARW